MNATDAVVAEMVSRLLQELPLLPLPEASQDLGLLAFTLDRQSAALKAQRAAIERVRQLADEAAAEQELLWPVQVIDALDGES